MSHMQAVKENVMKEINAKYQKVRHDTNQAYAFVERALSEYKDKTFPKIDKKDMLESKRENIEKLKKIANELFQISKDISLEWGNAREEM